MPEPTEAPSIAAAHALQLAELVARWGVTADQLFEGTGFDTAVLAEPRARITVPMLETLATRAVALTGEPALGFTLGVHHRISSHGYLGFAAMAAPTLGDALDLAVRFAPTRTDAVALRAHVGDGVASLVVEELCPLGAAREILIASLIIGFQQAAEALTGQQMAGSADFAFPEPPHAARFKHIIRGGMRFGQPAHQIVFDPKALSLPLVMADPIALELAKRQCERELDDLRLSGAIATRVRTLLPKREGGFLGLDDIAKALGLSTRTLKRRLADEGTDFTTLLDEQRRERAFLLLRSADHTVETVADRLGYSDVANFTRAFRRWAGTTPTAYRRGVGKSGERRVKA